MMALAIALALAIGEIQFLIDDLIDVTDPVATIDPARLPDDWLMNPYRYV